MFLQGDVVLRCAVEGAYRGVSILGALQGDIQMTLSSDDNREAWFKLRYAAEKAAEAWATYAQVWDRITKAETQRLATLREEAKLRAQTMEQEYQQWRANRESNKDNE
jgi:inactivated superfamily I helicase